MDGDDVWKREAQIARRQEIRAWLGRMAANRGYEGDRAEDKVEEWMVDPANVDWKREDLIAPRQKYSSDDVADLQRLLGETE